ncbi:DDE-type integrase/transposase/recombinase [Aureimonas sp. AU12]|uniref:DDE-type integrase/transposase/recombinase n=1 Tax=Aureimonas sp. AU12 TaxID=1638161 RepID=UPI0009EB8B8C
MAGVNHRALRAGRTAVRSGGHTEIGSGAAGILVRRLRERLDLSRAIGNQGKTLDFHLPQNCTSKAAKRFLIRALNRSPHNRPSVILTDESPACNEVIASPRRDGRLAETCQPADQMPEQSARV